MPTLRATCLLALGAASLFWVALVNGQPLIGVDTAYYLRGADYTIAQLTDSGTRWEGSYLFTWDAPDVEHAAPPGAAALPDAPPVTERAVLRGRSLYYGALVYMGGVAGGFWLTIALQAAMIAGCAYLMLRRFLRSPALVGGSVLAVLAVTTPLAFYVGYVMPDILAATTVLASANLLLFWSAQSRAERMAWLLVLILSAAVHLSHVLIAGGMLAVAACWWLAKGRRLPARGGVAVALALVVGIAATAFDTHMLTMLSGRSPVRPPFIAARVIGDGPGYTYLKDTCPGSGWTLCAYLDRMPDLSTNFLWQHPAWGGVFPDADAATKRAFEREEIPFVLAAAAHDPVRFAIIQARNWIGTMLRLRVQRFDYDVSMKRNIQRLMPPDVSATLMETAAARHKLPVVTFAVLSYLSFGLAAAYLGWLLLWRPAVDDGERAARRLALLIGAGIVINAGVCGILSAPVDRYQARVSWLLPLAAITVAVYRARPPLRSYTGPV